MRIVTVNCNGIRSATSKGMFTWLKRQKPDVICLQEIKALESDLPPEALPWKKWHAFFHPADKKGYAGVALYCKREPDRVQIGTGIKWIDAEGRYLQADFGNLSVYRSMSRRARPRRSRKRKNSASWMRLCRI